MLQAKIDLEAQPLQRTDVAPWCQGTHARYVHTRTVSPETWLGEVCLPVWTCQGRGCGASLRPDDRHLGVPQAGDFTDDGRVLYAPLVAALPQRGANDLLQRCTGVARSSQGAQGLMDSTAQDLQRWPTTRETQETAAVAEALGVRDRAVDRRVAGAMDGGMAHSDGRWQEAPVATILGRRREAPADEPTLGAVLARRDVGSWVRGQHQDLAPTNLVPRPIGSGHG